MITNKLFYSLVDEIQTEVLAKINSWKPVEVKVKPDGTKVTNIDLMINNLICKKFEGCKIISEENSDQHLGFPAIVVDPVDGTKELIKDNKQWSISIAYVKNPSDWEDCEASVLNIYDTNFTNFTLDAEDILVSRSEMERQLYDQSKANFKAIGSIAYKLKLLSLGKGKAVITKRPKSLWDLAAGTILGHKAGYKFYENGKLVNSFDKIRYTSPMIWCKPQDFNIVEKLL